MADHAGNAQATFGDHTVLVKVPAMEVGVGHDSAARYFIERNVFGIQVGCTGHHHRVAHALGVLQRPAQGLHAAQAAAQDRS